ncbi:hypothetical protein K435DRAFT_858425 [Dendrothele bispora CBS 962.96]|uniref:Uncharacterized protein n=1 Tax=Dendrothele bispora (strain CBS 962.96) TaxID=1314807 RepID=A0A4S8M3R4_DENBC|nr:hypothetical protein K435DRAFT_858425 [Dendrothele bispora CBS 962.96]
MPISLQVIATLPPTKAQVNAEELPLYFPSMLTSGQRKSELCRPELAEMEIKLRDDQKVKAAASTYRNAWKAKLALVGGNKNCVKWEELQDEHIVCMEDLQDIEKKNI